MDSCTGAKQLHKMKCFSFWSNNKFSESFCPSVWSTLTSRKWTTHTKIKAESHWMGEGECEHRVILGKLGLTPFRGKQQSDRRQSHRQTMNRDRTSDCGRDVVTSADLCDTHMNVSISDLKSDSVRSIKPLVSWRGDPAAGLQWSETLRRTAELPHRNPAWTRSFEKETMQTPEPKRDTKRLFISQPI